MGWAQEDFHGFLFRLRRLMVARHVAVWKDGTAALTPMYLIKRECRAEKPSWF